MVRKRGRARRSYGIKRAKKQRIKLDPRIISLRFKERIEPMAVDLDFWLRILDELERRVKVLCEAQGIPTEELDKYFAYSKKQFSKITRFRALTLWNEIQIWIATFFLRGLKKTKMEEIVPVLEQLYEDMLVYRATKQWQLINDYFRYKCLAILRAKLIKEKSYSLREVLKYSTVYLVTPTFRPIKTIPAEIMLNYILQTLITPRIYKVATLDLIKTLSYSVETFLQAMRIISLIYKANKILQYELGYVVSPIIKPIHLLEYKNWLNVLLSIYITPRIYKVLEIELSKILTYFTTIVTGLPMRSVRYLTYDKVLIYLLQAILKSILKTAKILDYKNPISYYVESKTKPIFKKAMNYKFIGYNIAHLVG